MGRRADVEELFESFVWLAGPTWLLPEEYDPVAERSLGNHPQAYSHLGLIRCARCCQTCLRRSGREFETGPDLTLSVILVSGCDT